MEPGIIEEAFDRHRRLAQLGLEESTLMASAMAGLHQRLSMTENHPPLSHGFCQWSWTVASLREQLIPEGWRPNNDGNLPIIVSSDQTLAISVMMGDDATANPNAFPMSKSPKGPMTSSCVRSNVKQLMLADVLPSFVR